MICDFGNIKAFLLSLKVLLKPESLISNLTGSLFCSLVQNLLHQRAYELSLDMRAISQRRDLDGFLTHSAQR